MKDSALLLLRQVMGIRAIAGCGARQFRPGSQYRHHLLMRPLPASTGLCKECLCVAKTGTLKVWEGAWHTNRDGSPGWHPLSGSQQCAAAQWLGPLTSA